MGYKWWLWDIVFGDIMNVDSTQGGLSYNWRGIRIATKLFWRHIRGRTKSIIDGAGVVIPIGSYFVVRKAVMGQIIGVYVGIG